MAATSPPAASRLRGLDQKVLDWGGYVWRRMKMRLRYHVRRARHWWRFRGRPARILIVRLASIGDVVRATAIVQRLKAEYPDASIDFLTSSACVSIVASHPALRAVYTLEQFAELPGYDWVVNLQTRNPPDTFLRGASQTYRELLRLLSDRFPSAWHSGRRFVGQIETFDTNVLYCRSEMEELFLIALLAFDPEQYPGTHIAIDTATRENVVRRFQLPEGRPLVGVFLGSNSIGCGADEGFRTYSLEYLERLIQQLSRQFSVVVIGQSQVRNAEEREQYRQLLARNPDVTDLVDRTTLGELLAIVSRFSLLVSSDSSPVHIALAAGVPVVGLYVSDASFRMSPRTTQPTFVALDSVPPCFYHSWRWRFFCESCRSPDTRARYCREPVMAFGVDRIPVDRVRDAARLLLQRSNDENRAQYVARQAGQSSDDQFASAMRVR